ncbi:MAG: hypothetical protein DLM57_15325 [Pseudonocardiales bacterium]|nr:MAG: hypothetical protein DLM57_15325 [Pseudonocardiales bacterium]
MSDTTKGSVEAEPADRPTPPRTINLATAAVCVQIGFALLYAALQWPLGNQLRRAVTTSNNQKKTPSPLCDAHPGKGCLDPAKAVHSFQTQTAISTLLVVVVIVYVLLRIRKGIRSARTVYVAVSLVGVVVGFAGTPLALLAVISSGPVAPRAVTTAAAAGAAAAIVLLFLPESRGYFDRMSPRRKPGQARAGRGSLFRPPAASDKVPAVGLRKGAAPAVGLRKGAAPGVGLRKNAALPAAPPAAARAEAAAQGTSAGPRAKVRSDEAAVARGAALARSRAKASKSRRTEL